VIDGEQISGLLSVHPETFVALADSLSRRRQHRLLHGARGIERHTTLWRNDHMGEYGPQLCGYSAD
jgi:hypothetical protein